MSFLTASTMSRDHQRVQADQRGPLVGVFEHRDPYLARIVSALVEDFPIPPGLFHTDFGRDIRLCESGCHVFGGGAVCPKNAWSTRRQVQELPPLHAEEIVLDDPPMRAKCIKGPEADRMDQRYSFYLCWRRPVRPPEVMVFACRLMFLVSLTLAFAQRVSQPGRSIRKRKKRRSVGRQEKNLLGISHPGAAEVPADSDVWIQNPGRRVYP